MVCPRRTYSSLVVCLLLALAVEANMFARSFSKLRYDIISVASPPSNAQSAEVVQPGKDIAVGRIDATAEVPKDGVWGILFDMGYACQPGMGNTTLPLPDFAGLTKVALIRRGDCNFRTKIINASLQGASATLIYNNPGDNVIDSATAALKESSDTLTIPAVLMSYQDGTLLLDNLEQTKQSTGGSLIHHNRVRVTLTAQQVIPGIWEFILIVVVVLLGVSFTVSVVLHCRLYALRQRVRMDMIARGADVLPNGTLRMRRVTMKKANLDAFQVHIYREQGGSSSSTAEQPEPTITASTSNSTVHASPPSPSAEASPSHTTTPDDNVLPSTVLAGKPLSRANSTKSIHSLNPVGSTRSETAADGATRLTVDPEDSCGDIQLLSTTVPAVEGNHNSCSICLEDFADGDELRTLPCHHEFHCECIDPWLTSKSSTCPLCKYDCLPPTDEELEGRGEDRNVIVPNDRFIEFVMGPDWVHARTMHNHHRVTFSDRMGQVLVNLSDRLHRRRRRQESPPTNGVDEQHADGGIGASLSPPSTRTELNDPQPESEPSNQDEVPLQVIITDAPTAQSDRVSVPPPSTVQGTSQSSQVAN